MSKIDEAILSNISIWDNYIFELLLDVLSAAAVTVLAPPLTVDDVIT